MLFLISPAKSLDYETPAGKLPHTLPLFAEQTAQLIAVLRRKSARQLASLMGISDALATLNAQRFKAWSPEYTEANAKQAVLAFDGDVYGGLEAKTLKQSDLAWAQEHLCILSGLYGVLRPLDWMQPYRLEMGTALPIKKVTNLYRFWGAQIAQYLNERARAVDERGHSVNERQHSNPPVIVNLASQEYFKSVDRKTLAVPVLDCVFEEKRNGQYKVISFMAKRARGLMCRYAITQRATTPANLEGFNLEGYAFDSTVSTPERMMFRRDSA